MIAHGKTTTKYIPLEGYRRVASQIRMEKMQGLTGLVQGFTAKEVPWSRVRTPVAQQRSPASKNAIRKPPTRSQNTVTVTQ